MPESRFPGPRRNAVVIWIRDWLCKPPARGSRVRFHHLDALRGLAALLVAFHHSLRPFSIPRDGILSLVTSESAVIFFFILSGFVLSGSMDSKGGLGLPSLLSYFVKRAFRLYPLALAAMVFALLVSCIYRDLPAGTPVSEWMGRQIHDVRHLVGFRQWSNVFLLQPNYPYFQYIPLDPPLWTIRAEFGCSLILPFLLIAVRILPFVTLPIAIYLGVYFHRLEASDPMSAYRYLLQFFLGYLVYRFYQKSEKVPVKYAAWIMSALFGLLMAANHFKWGVIPESLIIAGMMLFLVPCSPQKLRKLLETPLLGVWGRISYSFYALHWPVLLVSLSLMLLFVPEFLSLKPTLIPGMTIFLVSVGMTYLLALFSERFIERPFNEMGRWLGNKLGRVPSLILGSRAEVGAR